MNAFASYFSCWTVSPVPSLQGFFRFRITAERSKASLPQKPYDPELNLDSLGTNSDSHEPDNPLLPLRKRSFNELQPSRFEDTGASFRSRVN